MANAVHLAGKGETLTSLSARYYALRRGDVAGRARVIAAIGAATPTRLPDLADDALPEGVALFIPTLRAFNRALFTGNAALTGALERKGFDHARKLLRYEPVQVIRLLSPLPPEFGADAVNRAWTLTAFLNLDGMDLFTARHLVDVARIRSLQDLARTDRATLDDILQELVAKHSRPEALREQRHAERWPLEAKILTRKRVSELALARGRLFQTPFAPTVAARTAEFYESSAQDDALTSREASLSSKLGRLHRFQEAVLRGNLCISSGRWAAAVDAYQQARRHWHRLGGHGIMLRPCPCVRVKPPAHRRPASSHSPPLTERRHSW